MCCEEGYVGASVRVMPDLVRVGVELPDLPQRMHTGIRAAAAGRHNGESWRVKSVTRKLIECVSVNWPFEGGAELVKDTEKAVRRCTEQDSWPSQAVRSTTHRQSLGPNAQPQRLRVSMQRDR